MKGRALAGVVVGVGVAVSLLGAAWRLRQPCAGELQLLPDSDAPPGFGSLPIAGVVGDARFLDSAGAPGCLQMAGSDARYAAPFGRFELRYRHFDYKGTPAPYEEAMLRDPSLCPTAGISLARWFGQQPIAMYLLPDDLRLRFDASRDLFVVTGHNPTVHGGAEQLIAVFRRSGPATPPRPRAPGAAAPAIGVVAGERHTCVLLEGGRVRCWGQGADGRLGYDGGTSVGLTTTPAEVGDIDLGARATRLTAGVSHTCALLDGGRVRCWGQPGWGALGSGRNGAGGDVDLGGKAVDLAAGAFHTCALLEGGRVRCWGNGIEGRLGYGNRQDVGDSVMSPAAAGDVDVGGRVTALAAGGDHTCAILEGGRVRCWGAGGFGQLGYGDNRNVGEDAPPSAAGYVDLGGRAVAIAAGDKHTCALLEGGGVRCWGRTDSGALGYADEDAGVHLRAAPGPDLPIGGAAVAIAAGADRTCAILEGGRLRCWGTAYRGALGYPGSTRAPAEPRDVDVGAATTAIALGSEHTCAVIEGGRVRCWGDGRSGQLGYGVAISFGLTEPPAAAGDVPLF